MSNKTHAQVLREWMDKLSEAPLADYDVDPKVATSKNYGTMDKNLAKVGKARIRVLKDKFANTPYNFRFFIVDGGSHQYSIEALRKDLSPEMMDKIESNTSGAITLVITSNQSAGAENEVYDENGASHQLTPWIMTHLVAHASEANGSVTGINYGLLFDNFESMLRSSYEDHEDEEMVEIIIDSMIDSNTNSPISAFMNTAAARSDQHNGSNEAIHDLFSMYILTGKVTLLPFAVGAKRLVDNNNGDIILKPEAVPHFSSWPAQFAKMCESEFKKVLNSCVGKIIIY